MVSSLLPIACGRFDSQETFRMQLDVYHTSHTEEIPWAANQTQNLRVLLCAVTPHLFVCFY